MVRLGQFQGQYVLYSDTWHPNRENSTQSNAAVGGGLEQRLESIVAAKRRAPLTMLGNIRKHRSRFIRKRGTWKGHAGRKEPRVFGTWPVVRCKQSRAEKGELTRCSFGDRHIKGTQRCAEMEPPCQQPHLEEAWCPCDRNELELTRRTY